MSVAYPPEPLLAEGACSALYEVTQEAGSLSFSSQRIGDMMQTFVTLCINGLVSAGTIGEILARIIISISYDLVHLCEGPLYRTDETEDPKVAKLASRLEEVKIDDEAVINARLGVLRRSKRIRLGTALDLSAKDDDLFSNMSLPTVRRNIYFTNSIPVDMFLRTLIGKGYWDAYKQLYKCPVLTIPDKFEHGQVRFTNWSCLEVYPMGHFDEAFLQKCFESCCAVILPPNHPGADFLIPVKIACGPKTEWSAILIQVKNRESVGNSRLIYAGKKLTPKNCFGKMPTKNAKKPRSKNKSAKTSVQKILSNCPKDYVALYMEIGPEGLSHPSIQMAASLVQKFHGEFPTHGMLLGMDYGFLENDPLLRSNFLQFHRRHVQRVDIYNRHAVAKLMNPISRYYSGPCCRCQDQCSLSSNCGCVLQKWRCGSSCTCNCLHKE